MYNITDICWRQFRWLSVSLLVMVIDQLSKYIVIHHFYLGHYVLLPWLNINLTYNRGIAFSLLSGMNRGFLYHLFVILLPILMLVGIAIWLLRRPSSSIFLGNLQSFALAMLLGGGVSNLGDRLMKGYVCDFIDFHIGTWHFAIFNIADSSITIGLVLLAFVLVKQSLS